MAQQNPLKSKFLDADDLPTKRVDFSGVPGWEGRDEFHVRVMDGHERNQYEEYTLRLDSDNKLYMHRQDVWAFVAVLTVCDENGKRVFDDRDLQSVTRKSGHALKRIYEAAAALNLLNASEETAGPNSTAADGADSSKTSAGTSESLTPENSSPAATAGD